MTPGRLAAALCACVFTPLHAQPAAQPIEFNRDIRPILSDKCFTCHGPDAANRKTKLRFDLEAAAKADLGKSRYAIVPGDPARNKPSMRGNRGSARRNSNGSARPRQRPRPMPHGYPARASSSASPPRALHGRRFRLPTRLPTAPPPPTPPSPASSSTSMKR